MRSMQKAVFLAVFVVAGLGGCGKKDGKSDVAPAISSSPPLVQHTSSGLVPPPTGAPVVTPAEKPPADGKYERVTVEGVTVPVIEIMNGGSVVLVDTDGKKPRTWEEQYKKKSDSLAPGQFDLHKTDTNKNGSFEDDAVDKTGLWIMDGKGNITKH